MSNKINALKEQVLKAQENADIAQLYVLQDEAQETFDEDTLGAFYANILDLALEKLTHTLESYSKLQMEETQDFATLRALYEYAMEHYHAGANKDASALFEVLGGITDDELFSASLLYHKQASSKEISLDEFMEKYCDIDATQKNNTFYISSFKKKAQELLDNAQTSGE